MPLPHTGKLSRRERKSLARCHSVRRRLTHTPLLSSAPLSMPLPGWLCFMTGRQPLTAFSTLGPNYTGMVSNRFLISKPCLTMPQKIRVGTCYPLPSLLPFEVSDIWFQLRGAQQLNGQLPRAPSTNTVDTEAGCCCPTSVTRPGLLRPLQPSLPPDLTSSPPTNLRILLPNIPRKLLS